MGGIWETFGGYLEVKLSQNKPKTYQKLLQKFSTDFLIQGQKRVLPKDSHHFLLDPINPLLFGLLWSDFDENWSESILPDLPELF